MQVHSSVCARFMPFPTVTPCMSMYVYDTKCSFDYMSHQRIGKSGRDSLVGMYLYIRQRPELSYSQSKMIKNDKQIHVIIVLSTFSQQVMG